MKKNNFIWIGLLLGICLLLAGCNGVSGSSGQSSATKIGASVKAENNYMATTGVTITFSSSQPSADGTLVTVKSNAKFTGDNTCRLTGGACSVKLTMKKNAPGNYKFTYTPSSGSVNPTTTPFMIMTPEVGVNTKQHSSKVMAVRLTNKGPR